jgi:hypothetical protein
LPDETKRLLQDMNALIDEVDRVRAVLLRYKKVSAQLASRVEQGTVLADALEQLEGAVRRREVTESMEELEGARHRVRLAMFALGNAQGTSASELGRKLGVSRQLASRLANEAAAAFE